MENLQNSNPGSQSDVGGAPSHFAAVATRDASIKAPESEKTRDVTKENTGSDNTCSSHFTPAEEESGIKSLFKLFSHDVSMAIAANTNVLPSQTECVKGPMNKSSARTPGTYYSSLRLFGIRLPAAGDVAAVDNHKVWIPTPYAIIDNSPHRCYDTPMATPFGLELARMLNADLANSTTARAFVQVTRVTDQQSLVALVGLAQQRPADFYDEAPLVRMLLLWQLFAQPADYKAIHERAVSEVVINGRTGPLDSIWTRHTSEQSGQIKPGRGDGVSSITVVTITEYQVMQSGDLNGNIGMPDPNVIIPVRQEMSGQDWLIPYIISFTTTGWWNHSMYVESQMLSVNTGVPLSEWRLKFLPQACLPVVEGEYSRIMLVCVNKVGENDHGKTFVMPGQHGDLDIHYGVVETGFAEHVYTWLGVGEVDNHVVNMSNEVASAWSHLIETVAVDGVITKAVATVAEMTRTRWNGSMVKSGLNINEGDHHGISLPPYKHGEAGNPNINGEPIPNILDYAVNWNDINPRLSVLTEWRSTPLCQMHKSAMYLGDGEGRQDNLPHAAGWSCHKAEYCLSESYHVNRILVARDIFRHSTSISKYRFRSTKSLMVFISETATLIGAVANWVFCYYGFSLTAINRLYPIDRNVPYAQHQLIAKATNSLVIPSYGTKWQPYPDGNLLNILRIVSNRPQFQYSSWKSLPLPWWLVEAVSSKFGLVYKVRSKPSEVCVADGVDEDADGDWLQGHAVDKNTMWATSGILTSDDRYIAHGRYLVLAHCNRGYDLNTWLGWNSDLFFDSIVDVQCEAIGVPSIPNNQLDVNLLTVPFVQDNSLRETGGPTYFISASSPNSSRSWMKCEHPIRYPDPIQDHLVRAGKAAIPELVVGNVPGAIKAAVLSAADPALNWALNKMADVSGMDLFRPSGSS